jgi:hypothetical protein
MRQVIGWSLIGIVFLILFAGSVASNGLAATVVSWVLAFIVLGVIVLARPRTRNPLGAGTCILFAPSAFLSSRSLSAVPLVRRARPRRPHPLGPTSRSSSEKPTRAL